MAKCDLRIELEPGKSTWELGGVVRGEVVVSTDGDVKCDGLSVRATWATHGKGNRAHGEAQWVKLFEGEWTGGPERRYPFELMLPSQGPVRYHGHYLNVGWFIQATADIPWKLDPTTEIELEVEPDSGTEPDWKAQFQTENHVPLELRLEGESDAATQKAEGCGKVVGWVFGLGCLAIVVAGLAGFGGGLWAAVSDLREVVAGERAWGDAIGATVFVAIALFVVLGIVVGIARTVLRRRKLGEVRLAIEPAIAGPGDEIRITLAGQPPSALQLNRATVRLRGQEEVVRGSGTNKSTYRHDLHDETLEIGMSRPLAARIPFQIEGTLRIPESAPPSFGASSNELKWWVDVDMDIARCPDWSEKKTLVVAPGIVAR